MVYGIMRITSMGFQGSISNGSVLSFDEGPLPGYRNKGLSTQRFLLLSSFHATLQDCVFQLYRVLGSVQFPSSAICISPCDDSLKIFFSLREKMVDYKGQELGENLISLVFLVICIPSWIVGFVYQRFLYTFYGWLGACGVAALVRERDSCSPLKSW